ncbi:ATP translocase [Parahalioglobus pacificus]|uniref:ADP,ATP carrier protein n=1 Tax=Parahalioglobus pacificus TaxID=930806 RepID=A0A918XHV0_9GAMM|nr:ATP translocase [Halioglobus pacificus]GHD32632.1 hypothetical protein GCM10007053_17160 [Halioglobus pacificus]
MHGYTQTERFLSLFTALRSGEGDSALRLCLQSFVIMFAYYLLKVIREPLILADGSAELRAYTTAAQAMLLMLIVPLFTRAYLKVRLLQEKHHLFRHTLLFFIANLSIFAIAHAAGLAIGVAFYIWLGIFAVMIPALFWAFAADLYNLKSGQRIFPLIAAAAAFGALLGSGVAGELDVRVGHHGVIIAAAVALLLPWMLSRRTEQFIPTGSRSLTLERGGQVQHPLLEGFLVVWRSRYLTLIAIFVILLNLINTNGEYILAEFVTDEAARHNAVTGDADAYITGFYSQYLFITTLLGFLIQLFLVSRIYERVGIAGALHILPILMIISYSAIALLPLLVVVRLALIAENSLNYSLQTTTRHALFLPVEREEKYVGKHIIDTFFFRLGDVLSGGFVYLASTLVGLGIVGFVSINIVLAGLLLVVSRAIGQRHSSTAAEQLNNMAPEVACAPADLYVTAGASQQMALPSDTFVDPDVGDALKYQAFATHSDRLPAWIKFDTLNRTFTFAPPPRAAGSLRIRVVARDYDGLEAELSFTVNYGAGA